MNKHDVIVRAIDKMKKSQFGLTGIKVELEAHLGRGPQDDEYCHECEEDGYSYCGCDEGYRECYECEGNYEVNGILVCTYCDSGQISCEEEGCYEGIIDCTNEDCEEGRLHSTSGEYSSVNVCHDFILERLEPLGLAEKIPEGESYSLADVYRPKSPLVYSQFYNDGSVDSEHTFTLLLEDSKTILLLPKFLEIFKELGEEIDNRFDVSGAGMHMALLNSENAIYPTVSSGVDRQRFYRFSRATRMLLPALFFLSSHDDTSRPLRYRQPQVSDTDKYSAIAYRDGSLEFRVFETCYDSPETILDNVVIMSNCMRYWTDELRIPKLPISACRFGIDNSNSLDRLYATKDHIDLLNSGLRLLKPSYYSIRDIKLARNFKTTKHDITAKEKELLKDIERDYAEYENRFEWRMLIAQTEYVGSFLRDRSSTGLPPTQEDKEIAEVKAREVVKMDKARKKPLDLFKAETLKDKLRVVSGQYHLSI